MLYDTLEAMEKCSVIIATFNDSSALAKCLDSLEKVEYPREDMEIIVVDNASTDDTFLTVKRYKEISYVFEPRKGASFARNTGIRAARHDILVFLDSDTIVDEKWLLNLTEPFTAADIGAVGGEIRPAAEGNLISEYLSVSLFMRYHRYGRERNIKGYPSCNLAVRKRLVPRGFDTDRFTTYGEDKDLCYRVIGAGYRIVYKPGAVVYHDHPSSLKELTVQLVKSSKGRLAFGDKYRGSADTLIFKYHLPALYLFALLYAAIAGGAVPLIITASPAVLLAAVMSAAAYADSKKPLLSCLVKPLLDTYSLFVIYFSYQYYNIERSKK